MQDRPSLKEGSTWMWPPRNSIVRGSGVLGQDFSVGPGREGWNLHGGSSLSFFSLKHDFGGGG